MSLHSDTQQTIGYYDEHAEEYIRGTLNVDMASLYLPFLELLPRGARLLDAGCGSGRDTKAFLDLGFDVTSIDASKQMVLATKRISGNTVHQRRLQEIEFHSEFDGVWACASLLHVSMTELRNVIDRLSESMRAGGVCYMSFKEGEGERIEGGRRFSDFTASGLSDYLADQESLIVERIWVTEDARPERNDRWVNTLAKKLAD